MTFDSAQVVRLERTDATPKKSQVDNEDHPMRIVTRDVAFNDESWTSSKQSEVSSLFDQMAAGWTEKDFSHRGISVFDCFKRGGVTKGRIGLELGCGTGAYSDYLAAYFESLLCVDISQEMLQRSVATSGFLTRGDGSNLPLRDGSVDAVICINTLLFPKEVDRVLSPGGCLVWISTSGESTPIYLSTQEVARALGPKFRGVTSEAGEGIWSVFHRA